MKITTLEQLEALPDGTVLKDWCGNFGEILHKRIDLSEGDFSHIPEDADLILPATAYIPTTITQKQLTTATEALHISLGGEDAKDYIERGGSPLDSDFTALKAALKTLGISVEGEDE